MKEKQIIYSAKGKTVEENNKTFLQKKLCLELNELKEQNQELRKQLENIILQKESGLDPNTQINIIIKYFDYCTIDKESVIDPDSLSSLISYERYLMEEQRKNLICILGE